MSKLTKDKPEDVKDVEIPKRVNPREEMMSLVVNQSRDARDASMKDDDADGLLDNETIDNDDLKEFEDADNADDLGDEASENNEDLLADKVDNDQNLDNTRIIDRDGEHFVRAKIDGIIQEVPLGTVVERLQKSSDSDASNVSPVSVEEQSHETSDTTQPVVSSPPAVDKVKQRSNITDALQKLVDTGDVTGATDDLMEVLQPAVAVSLDEDTVRGIVREESTTLDDTRDLKSSYATFRSDKKYKALVDDDFTKKLLDTTAAEVVADKKFMSDDPTYTEIFEEAGDRLLGVLNVGDTEVVAETDVGETIRDKKLNQPTTVSSRTVRRQAPVEKKKATTSEIISGMKIGRGQTY